MLRHTREIEAVVFPLRDLYIDRFFGGGKNVFIKFPTHEALLINSVLLINYSKTFARGLCS